MKTISEMIELRKRELDLTTKLDQIQKSLEELGFAWNENTRRHYAPAEDLGFFYAVTIANPMIVRNDLQVWDRDKESWEWASDNDAEPSNTFYPQDHSPEEIIRAIVEDLENVIGRAPWTLVKRD